MKSRAAGPSDANARSSLAVWVVLATALAAAQFLADRARSPLDDRDLVFQRPGFLDAHGPAFAAPKIEDRFPAPDVRSVLFFVRDEQVRPLASALVAWLPGAGRVSVAVVVPMESAARDARGIFPGPDVAVFSDPSAGMARGYRMPRPRDGDPPVGYAIVDTRGQVRYRTLDPGVAHRLAEVRTMLRATP
ncbi:MAG: hypothetical protein M3R62_10390 [Acidobacteriota bacterium]|nr:hypothetical protein [Acidobacteriota bacterium]